MLVPEIVLAREAEICLALLGIPINYAPGLAPRVDRRGAGSMEEAYFQGPHRQLPAILRETMARIPVGRACPCAKVAFNPMSGRMTPRQLGPRTRSR